MGDSRMMRTDTIERVQTALRSLGLYEGPVDGISGPLTQEAVRQYQRLNGLAVDGIPGPKTRHELYGDTRSSLKEFDSILQPVGPTPTQDEVPEFFGEPGSHLKLMKLPYEMEIAWTPGHYIDAFTCHSYVIDRMQAIFEKTLDHYSRDGVRELGLDQYGGCFNIRDMRGAARRSMHSWGIAVDIDPARNRYRWDSRRAKLAQAEYIPFWNIVEAHGATSLGRQINRDWMHFQFARI